MTTNLPLHAMKIAIVHPIPLVPGTIDLLAYARRFEELGHECILVTSKYLRDATDIPVFEHTHQQMSDASTWRALGIDVAVTFVWFQYPQITEALASAGVRVVSRADTDGQQSIRVFPGNYFRCMVGAASRERKLLEFKSWLHRYLIRYRAEDQSLLRTVAASRCVAIETSQAAKNLRRVLNHYGRADLASRVVVVPHCVDDLFLNFPVANFPVAADRPKTVIAIGRWTAPQKNPQLMLAVMREHLRQSSDTRFVIIGPGAKTLCGGLAQNSGRVNCRDHVPLAEIPGHLAAARVLLSSSRWEGSPISANEALASGCTVVGTPIPAFIDIAAAGPFGSVARNHSAAALHNALARELTAWETGHRSPAQIASFWQPKLSQRRVMQQLLTGAQLGEQPSASSPGMNAVLQPQIS